jgi:DNA-binding MarR family transcriptional regulator
MIKVPNQTVIGAWVQLMKAQQMALSHIEQSLKKAKLPALVWYDVLLEVERAGPTGLRPFELERAMLLAQYNLSRLVDRIEVAGYVARQACQDDGRGRLIVITPEGQALRKRMWPIYAGAIKTAVGSKLTAEEAATLAGLLGRLIGPASRD